MTPAVVGASRRSGLVTVWSEPGSRGLVDVIATKSIALDGPPVAVGATLSDIVVELATRRWSDLDQLIVVGFGRELLGLDRVECLPDSESARRFLVDGSSGRRTPISRCVVVAPPIGRTAALQQVRSLVDLVHILPDTGLVCCDPSIAAIGCTWRLSAHRSTVDLRWRRVGRDPICVEPDRQETPDSLPTIEDDEAAEVTAAAITPEVVAFAPSGSRSTERLGELPDDQALFGDDPDSPSPAGHILVRVLGPVDVVGTRVSLDRRPRITELVVYLAFHPEGCSGEALCTALWPDRRVPGQTVANRLSEARQALGTTIEGDPRVRRVSSRHVLTDDVTTDWSQFDHWTRHDATPAEWAKALQLVRGRPFEGLPEGDWTLLEGLVPTMQGRIGDVACRLARLLVAAGDYPRAEWAVRRGLMANPWDERLYRMLMTVAHSAGNRSGIDAALRALAHILALRGDPLDAVHPETAELYRQLIASDELGQAAR